MYVDVFKREVEQACTGQLYCSLIWPSMCVVSLGWFDVTFFHMICFIQVLRVEIPHGIVVFSFFASGTMWHCSSVGCSITLGRKVKKIYR